MKQYRWILSGSLLALAMFAAADAHAARAYVSEAEDGCGAAVESCHGRATVVHQVGALSLAGVSPDKTGGQTCSLGTGHCQLHKNSACPLAPVGSVVGGVAEIASGPFILSGAVINDAYLLLTMPYRKAEPLN